jgi:hypothetical protein
MGKGMTGQRCGGFDVLWCRAPSNLKVRFGAHRSEFLLFGQIGIAAYLAALGHEVVCPEHRYWDRGHSRQTDKRPVKLVRRPLWPGYLPVRWNLQGGTDGQKNGLPVDAKAARWFDQDAPILGWGRNPDGSPWQMPVIEAEFWRNWRHRDQDETGARFRSGELVRATDARFDGHRLKIRFSRPSKRGGWEYVADTPPMLGIMAELVIHENDLALQA